MAGEGYLPPVVINVTGDISDFLDKLGEAKTALADFAKEKAQANLGADVTEFALAVAVANSKLADFDKASAQAKLGADLSEVVTNTELATNLVWKYSDSTWRAKLSADMTGLLDYLEVADNKLWQWSQQTWRTDLGVNASDALAGIGEADVDLQAYADLKPTVKLYTDLSPLRRGLLTAQTLLDTFTSQHPDVSLGVDIEALQAALAAAQTAIGKQVSVEASLKPLIETLAVADALLSDFEDSTWTAKLDADLKLLTVALTKAYKMLVDFSDTTAEAVVTLDSTSALSKLRYLKGRLQDLQAESFNVFINTATGDDIKDIEALRAAIATLPADTDTKISGSDTLLVRKLAQAQAALGSFASQVANSKLGADSAPFWEQITVLKALLSRDPATLSVKADINPALAQIAALKGALSVAKIGTLTQAISPGVSVLDGGGDKGGGFGAGAKALLGDLGWGKGGNLGGGFLGIPAMAAAGSVLGMAGFGAEHLAMTGVGLLGSAAGAGLGGLALGGTALGVAGVGMGTDMAGIGQAIGDAKKYTADMNALNQAIAVYGQGSTEAALATYQLNQDMAGIAPATVKAIAGLSNAASAFHTAFDKFTSPAEAIGAQILTQLVGVAQKFLPTIGKFATENMATMKKDLQPFFTWLDNPGGQGGLGIFTTLEKQFSKDLPTAIGVFTNAFELVGKTMAYLAPQTGKFMEALDKFFTKMNTTGFDKWISDVQKLVNLFHIWEDFIKVLVEDIAKLFGLTAGLGSGIIQKLTGYLQQLHTALDSTGKNSSLGALFRGHKQEVLELITVLVKLGTVLGGVYLQAAPTFIKLATLVLALTTRILSLVSAIPGGAELVGFTLLAAKMGALVPLLKGAADSAGLFKTAIGSIGFKGLFSGEDQGLMAKIFTSGPVTSFFDSVRLKGMYAADGIKNAFANIMGKVRDSGDEGFLQMPDLGKLKAWANSAGSTIKQWASTSATAIGSFVSAAGDKIGEWASRGKTAFVSFASDAASFIADFAKQMAEGAKAIVVFIAEHAAAAAAFVAENAVMIASATAAFVAENLATLGIVAGIAVLVAGIIYLATHWHQVWTDIKNWVLDAWHFIDNIFHDGIIGTLLSVAFPLIGLATHWQEAFGIVKDVVRDAYGVIVDVFHAIVTAADWLWQGIKADVKLVYDIFVELPLKILGYVEGFGSLLFSAGVHLIEGLVHGVESMIGSIASTVKHVASSILGGLGSLLGIASPSTITTGYGQMLGVGLANGITTSTGPAINAAKTMASQVTAAFGSLANEKNAASAIATLKTMFGNLGHVFDTLAKSAASAKNVGANVGIISTAMKSLTGTMSKELIGDINGVSDAFKGLANNKSLQTIGTEIGNLGHMFDTISRTAQSAEGVTVGALQSIGNAVTLVTLAAPGLVAGITGMTTAFMSFANTCTPGAQSVNKELGNISTTLGKLGGVFTAFSSLATQSSNITVAGMQSIGWAILTLNASLPGIMHGLEQTKAQFDKFHDWKSLFGDLNNLMVLFNKVSQVFHSISGAASASAGVTEPALAGIVKSVGNVSTALSNLPTAIYGANGPIVGMLTSLVNNMESAVNSGAIRNSFYSAGVSMMQGLQGGINAAAGAVGQAAGAAAANALAQAKAATNTHSPSLLFAQLGEDWMAGLVQGIHAKAGTVSAAVNGAVPTVHPASLASPITGHGMIVNATFQISAPGGDTAAIKKAVETDSAHQFAQAALTSMRAGAGRIY